MAKVIPRNTGKRAKKTKRFTTHHDDQEHVNIKVFEGEGAMTKNNHKLGQFLLSGLKSAAHRVPSIMVTFEFGFDGNLKVTADEKGTGKSGRITIKSDQNGLSEEQINRLIQEAEEYAEQDKALNDAIEGAHTWLDDDQDAKEYKKSAKMGNRCIAQS